MEISHSIHPLRQPNINDCWATATAMVLGLHGANAVSEIKRRASSVALNANGSIPPASVSSLARALHLRLMTLERPPQPLSTANVSEVLRTSCAAAFGSYNYPGAPIANQHVLLFYRIAGAENDPMVYFIDPYTARRYYYLVSEINEALGSVDYFLYR